MINHGVLKHDFQDSCYTLMRNTPEREKYIRDISYKYFGGKIIQQKQMSDEELKNVCEKGDYK